MVDEDRDRAAAVRVHPPAAARLRARRSSHGRNAPLGTHGDVHVALDLGRAERAVVDAHVVDPPGEPLAPDRVAAELQRRRSRRSSSRSSRASRPGRRSRTAATWCRRRCRRGASRRRSRARPCRARRAGRPRTPGAAGRPVLVLAYSAYVMCAACSLNSTVRHAVPSALGFTHASSVIAVREVELAVVGDAHEVVDAVERERAAVAPGRRPGRARQRAGMAVPRDVGQRRAGALVEAVRRDQAGRVWTS